MAVRVLTLMMSLWLVLSVFLWPHHGAVALTTWIPGLLIAAIAAVAIAFPPVRFANAALGLWVLAAAAASGSPDIMWSNGIAGLTALVAALVPALPREPGRAPRGALHHGAHARP
jgi:hypothetical protein